MAVGYLKSETTEVVPAGSFPLAPYTIGVRAIPIELRYQYRLPGFGPVRPHAALGGLWVAVRDSWTSDTPTESSTTSVYGVTGSVGFLVELGARSGIVLRAGYRGVTGGSNRPVRHIGLSGTWMDGGIEVRF